MKTRYSKYKSSGLLSFNEVPSHWNHTRIKYVGFMYGGLTGKSGDDFRKEEDDPSNKPFIPFTNICNNTYISKNELKLVSITENDNQNRVEKDDLFFMMTSETQEDVGKTSVLKEELGEVYLNTFCKGFRITDNSVKPYFLNYLLYGNSYRQLLSIEGVGYTRVNLRQDRVNDFIIFLPPLTEQEQIVKYLDEKTSQVDGLISITEKKIEVLKEKRTSLINTVVTKGLNPNVELKDSGVEWIGEIPKHWMIGRVGFVSNLFTGFPWKSEEFDFNEGIKIVRGENVSEGFLRWGERTRHWNKEVDENSIFFLRQGDIIISMDGSKVGKNYVLIKESDLPLLLHQRMCRVRVNKLVSEEFLCYFIGSQMFKYYIDITKTDPMIPHITQKDISDFKFSLPSKSEQKEIVGYLDRETTKIKTLISIEQRRIETLKEYRQSLISEVVTGKVRVCEEVSELQES